MRTIYKKTAKGVCLKFLKFIINRNYTLSITWLFLSDFDELFEENLSVTNNGLGLSNKAVLY